MNSFVYYNPTKLVFGRGAENETGRELAPLAAGKKVMIIYGTGSAVRSGLLARVEKSCREAGLETIEKGGVHPNPAMSFVRECITQARSCDIGLVLAVGGGSVIDTAKALSAGYFYDGDPWDFFCGRAKPARALPVACVLTIPAAGSEQSIRCVISEGRIKTGIGLPVLRPRAAFINPEIFFTLPPRQVSAGVLDMMSHIMERYFTNTRSADFVSGQAEAAMRSIMKNGMRLVDRPDDFEAWSEVGLAGSFAHNGYFGLGCEEDWACHGIEHALSGWDPSITHGEGLAVVIPAWMRYCWRANPVRFLRFAAEVMGVPSRENPEEMAGAAISKFCSFLRRMHLPMRLSELTDREVPFAEVAGLATNGGRTTLGHFKVLGMSDVEAILRSAR